jgi:hypothetical protein
MVQPFGALLMELFVDFAAADGMNIGGTEYGNRDQQGKDDPKRKMRPVLSSEFRVQSAAGI